jgi:hypothetical protein
MLLPEQCFPLNSRQTCVKLLEQRIDGRETHINLYRLAKGAG